MTAITYTQQQSDALVARAQVRAAAKRNKAQQPKTNPIFKIIASTVVGAFVLAAISAYAILGPIGFLFLLFFIGCFKVVAAAVLSLIGLA